MRRLALALCALVLAPACTGDGEPAASPSPILDRPVPSTAASLDAELALVAERLEIPGDGARERHERVQACIRLARLAADSTVRGLAGPRAGALETASNACPGDAAAAAAGVRAVLAAP